MVLNTLEKMGEINTAIDIKEYTLQWRCHLEMTENTRLPKRTFYYRHTNRSEIVRPEKRWPDHLSYPG
jgi:hypothetical protein